MSTHVSSVHSDISRAAPRALVTWGLALVPLVLLGILLALIAGLGPARILQSRDVPPVERLAVTRVELTPGAVHVSVLNDGPDPVSIAQVVVDDAFWTFTAAPGTTLSRLERTRITIPYPWVHGETHVVRLLTSTGLTFEHVIGVAVETPRPNARFFGVFALIGLYVGVLPVAIGLFWYPLVGRLGRRGLEFLLALTLGLLVFLLVDAVADGLHAAALVPGSLQGAALFVFGAGAAYFGLEWIGGRLSARRARSRAERPIEAAREGDGAALSAAGWGLAVLVAIGIGLHNFGEGLAIGSAFALGELGLGALLIVGFTLHNTTEGLAIVAPLARDRSLAPRPVPLWKLVQLGLIGGVPTILGAWLGGLMYSPAVAVLFLALGVGAIAQVSRQILLQNASDRGVSAHLREGHVLAGLACGVMMMYVTGLFVG